MKKSAARAVFGLVLASLAGSAWSFNTEQHRAATNLAADSLNATNQNPDIARFKNVIVNWVAGIGKPIPNNVTPGEQLAHVLNQNTDICVVPWNGGQYETIFNRIFTRYEAGNYSDEAAGAEGAYVYMGSALHLIEDQASMPHGANVRHGACPSFTEGFDPDNFENEPLIPSKVNVSLTANQGNVAPDQAYLSSLRQTRAIVGNYATSTGLRYWWRNEELTWDDTFAPRKISTPYDGEATPGDALFGAYGGVGYNDIFHDPEQPGLYLQQGKQATDYAYFFLSKMSRLLPPRSSEFVIDSGGASPIINNLTGTPIRFVVAENRTDIVDIDIWVQDTGQRIVSESATVSLTGFRSASGSTESQILPGPQTWLAQPVQLRTTTSQPIVAGTNQYILPFEGEINLNWKGAVASGAPLADGEHTLCLRAIDRDGNAPGQDTCVIFTMQHSPPKISVSAGNITVTANSGTLRYPISTRNSGGTFTLSGEGSPLESVTLQIDGIIQNALLSPSFTAGQTTYSGSIGGTMGGGTYKLSAQNSNPTPTALEWQVEPVDLSAQTVPRALGTYDPASRKFEIEFDADFTAPAGEKTLYTYKTGEPNSTTEAQPTTHFSSSEFPDLALSVGASVSWQHSSSARSFVLADNNDATTQLDVSYSLSAFPSLGGGALDDDATVGIL